MSLESIAESAEESAAIASIDSVESLGFPKCEVVVAVDHEQNSEVVRKFSSRRCSATRRGRTMRRSVHDGEGVHVAPPTSSRSSKHRLNFNKELHSLDDTMDRTAVCPIKPVVPWKRPIRPTRRTTVTAALP